MKKGDVGMVKRFSKKYVNKGKFSTNYPASVALFQLHGGMVSHMQALATPSFAVHNTNYLIFTTESILVLGASSWGNDVGM